MITPPRAYHSDLLDIDIFSPGDTYLTEKYHPAEYIHSQTPLVRMEKVCNGTSNHRIPD